MPKFASAASTPTTGTAPGAKQQRPALTEAQKEAKRQARSARVLNFATKALAKHQEHYRHTATGRGPSKDAAIVKALARRLSGPDADLKKLTKVIADGKPTEKEWKEFETMVARLDCNRAKTYEEMEEERKEERAKRATPTAQLQIPRMGAERSSQDYLAWVNEGVAAERARACTMAQSHRLKERIVQQTTMQTAVVINATTQSTASEPFQIQSDQPDDGGKNRYDEPKIKHTTDDIRTQISVQKQDAEEPETPRTPVRDIEIQQQSLTDSFKTSQAEIAMTSPPKTESTSGKYPKSMVVAVKSGTTDATEEPAISPANPTLMATVRAEMEKFVSKVLDKRQSRIDDLQKMNELEFENIFDLKTKIHPLQVEMTRVQVEMRHLQDEHARLQVQLGPLMDEHNARRERWGETKEQIQELEGKNDRLVKKAKEWFIREHLAALMRL